MRKLRVTLTWRQMNLLKNKEFYLSKKANVGKVYCFCDVTSSSSSNPDCFLPTSLFDLLMEGAKYTERII